MYRNHYNPVTVVEANNNWSDMQLTERTTQRGRNVVERFAVTSMTESIIIGVPIDQINNTGVMCDINNNRHN